MNEIQPYQPPPVKPLQLWNEVCTTPPKMTKEVSIGRKFTTIDPTWQLQRATELWGPYGMTWGLRALQYSILDTGEGPKSMMLVAEFWYPLGQFPIAVDMPFKNRDDCCKKLLTSARSKSLSLLGFSADIYMGKFEDAAYVGMVTKGYEWLDAAIAKIPKTESEEDLDKSLRKTNISFNSGQIPGSVYDEIVELIEQRRKELRGE